MKPAVAIYTRVSTEDQAKEGFSLDAQIERLRSYCEARGWSIYKEYVDDGYSGRDVKRPAYAAMMQEIDKWDILLVMKMDRIHRNSRNFMEMMDSLRKYDKEFVSMTESLDTSTAMGRFVVDIIQRIAQLESEQIGERVYMGMQQKASTGGILGFNAPFGYTFDEGKLQVVEKEAQIVKQIFDKYQAGCTLKEIVQFLNSNGIKTKKSNKWSIWAVRRILKNPIYAGYIQWDGILKKGEHAQNITDVSQFNAVQKLIQKRSIRRTNTVLIKEGV
jgi:DNA invertase Pin-like site-specific DNA recombinase